MADSFDPTAPLTPVAVKELEIVLHIKEAVPAQGEEPAIPRQYTGRYSFDRLAADDVIVDVRSGNLVPHLTATQINSIKAFMDAMLTKAQGTI